ncbi:cell wall-binding repeat-containing protein [Microbacterium aoyamense]|nr:cell wall-binding repeat-containing protein [Microbacterium aoyamense]
MRSALGAALVIGVVIAGVSTPAAASTTPTPMPTPTPSVEPSATPTTEPETAPTEEPTPAPEPESEYAQWEAGAPGDTPSDPTAGNIDGWTPSSSSDGLRTAATLAGFNPGNIISDAVFFNSGTMTEAQIQAFLNSKVPNCQSGYTCLKDFRQNTTTREPSLLCGGRYAGAGSESAARIIFKVAQACGINPQVILVTLQKEQGLVTHVWPSEWRYTIAMGQGCPDTAACDTHYYGFQNQVYGAAAQFKRYANPPGTSNYFTWYAPGKTWNVRYHPNAACGTSPVYIANQATANLYYYTPYQPNRAALAAGYAAANDACSSYGNRNFYNYFTDWFGSTQNTVGVCTPPSGSAVTAGSGEYRVTASVLYARKAPTTVCSEGIRSLTAGTIVTRTGTFGEWWRVRMDGVVAWVHSAYVTPTAPPTYSTTRISGTDRYATSVAVSKAAYPSGASTVYLAAGMDFPDALSAAAIASGTGASLLLARADGIPASVVTEMKRLNPTKVVLVGGEGVLQASLVSAAQAAMPSAAISRISGADRYETSVSLALAAFTNVSTAYIATGADFADALAASAIAGAKKAPVFLVDGKAGAVDARTLAALRSLGVTQAVIAGGTGAISAGVETSLKNAGLGVTRYGGSTRYQTSLLMNNATYPGTASTAYLATGMDFPDALSGTVLAGRNAAPLFSQPNYCMTGAAKDYMLTHGTSTATLIGGAGVLSAGVARSERC